MVLGGLTAANVFGVPLITRLGSGARLAGRLPRDRRSCSRSRWSRVMVTRAACAGRPERLRPRRAAARSAADRCGSSPAWRSIGFGGFFAIDSYIAPVTTHVDRARRCRGAVGARRGRARHDRRQRARRLVLRPQPAPQRAPRVPRLHRRDGAFRAVAAQPSSACSLASFLGRRGQAVPRTGDAVPADRGGTRGADDGRGGQPVRDEHREQPRRALGGIVIATGSATPRRVGSASGSASSDSRSSASVTRSSRRRIPGRRRSPCLIRSRRHWRAPERKSTPTNGLRRRAGCGK